MNGGSVYTDATATANRLHLLAELNEASNLMADSVTPEAAQFWKRHVIELQTQLGHIERSNRGIVPRDAESVMYRDDQLLPVLCQNAGYIPPSDDDLTRLPGIKARSQISRYFVPESTTNTLDPALQGLPMVDVVAPANLPEGFTFEAEIDGCRFMATVPAGGVRKGQAFTCYMRDAMDDASGAPTGRWRDGIFDCFRFGVCHPMLLNSFFCPLRKFWLCDRSCAVCLLFEKVFVPYIFRVVGLSQVMTRMGVDYLGLPGKDVPEDGLYSTRGTTLMILCLWLTLNAIFAGVYSIKKNTSTPVSPGDIISFIIINLGMYIYLIYVTSNTRAVLRQRYRIRDFCFRGKMEDLVCATACTPCVVSQMGRHTVSYIEHRGICCSDNGLEAGVMADAAARNRQGYYSVW
jgi:hypothetical protein